MAIRSYMYKTVLYVQPLQRDYLFERERDDGEYEGRIYYLFERERGTMASMKGKYIYLIQ